MNLKAKSTKMQNRLTEMSDNQRKQIIDIQAQFTIAIDELDDKVETLNRNMRSSEIRLNKTV